MIQISAWMRTWERMIAITASAKTRFLMCRSQWNQEFAGAREVAVVSVIHAMNRMIMAVAEFIGSRFGSRATTHAMKVMTTITRLSWSV